MMWTIAEQCLEKFKYNLSLSIRRVWSSVSNVAGRWSSTSTTSLLESKVFKISSVTVEWCCLSVNWRLRKRPYWLKLLYTRTSAFVFLIWNSGTSRCPLMKCVITWKILTPLPQWNSPYHCLRQTSKFHHRVSFSKYTESCEVLHKWIPKAVRLKRIPTHKDCKCEEFCLQTGLRGNIC